MRPSAPRTRSPGTLAEGIVNRLAAAGVTRMFGVPGGGSSLDLIDAGAAAGIDFVLTGTETAATIMAAVSGELSGVPGVALTGIGPGLASAVNGVAYAALERAPLVIVSDATAVEDDRFSMHQRFDQGAVLAPLVKATRSLLPDDGLAAFDDLLSLAGTPPHGPVHVDLSAAAASAPCGGSPPSQSAPAPQLRDEDGLNTARELLAASRRPIVLAGLEARGPNASQALRRLAEALAALVLTTYKAKGVVPHDHPQFAGLLTGGTAEAPLIADADLILCVGLDPVELIPHRWRHDAPVIDLAAASRTETPFEPALRLVGALDRLVESLSDADRVHAGQPSAWPPDAAATHRDDVLRRLGAAASNAETDAFAPLDVVEAAAAAALPDARATVDAGAHMFVAMAAWPGRSPYDVLKSNGLSTMGFALPAAIASALHEPERQVVALTGDGGLLMCLGELATAARLGVDVKIVVFVDGALSLIDIKQQQQQRERRGVRFDRSGYAGPDFATIARAMGVSAVRAAPGGDLRRTLRSAFAASGPVLVEVPVDPTGYGEHLAVLRG